MSAINQSTLEQYAQQRDEATKNDQPLPEAPRLLGTTTKSANEHDLHFEHEIEQRKQARLEQQLLRLHGQIARPASDIKAIKQFVQHAKK